MGNLLYGALDGFCTKQTCPAMTAGTHVYLWADGVKIKKPRKCSALEYVNNLLIWVESQLNDESLFPIEYGSEYPPNFMKVVKVIYKRYFRVYAHIYSSHVSDIEACKATAHLNTCFKHLIYFIIEFDLVVNPKKEFTPLQPLIDRVTGNSEEKS